MIQTSIGILTRIISNSYINVFQKIITQKGIHSSVINFFSYAGLTIISFTLYSFFLFKITNEFLLTFFCMGLLGALGNYYIIKALSIGELSSLAPINAYKPVVAMVIAMILVNEIPEPAAIIGIFLIICGNFLIFNSQNNTTGKALFYRILALVFSGTEAVFIKKIIILTNIPTSFFLWAVSGLIFSFLFLNFKQIKLIHIPIKEQAFLITLIGIMQYSTNFVFANMNVSYALALFQLSGILSVFLGVNIFKESNLKPKIIGSSIMIAGAILIILS